jgi:hypothetical protein
MTDFSVVISFLKNLTLNSLEIIFFISLLT